MKVVLLKAGPMPPPPLSAWHPMQLKLMKYFMPRSVACGSPCTGFLIVGRLGTAPGERVLTGTCMKTPGAFPPTLSAIFGRGGTLGCCACWGGTFCCAPTTLGWRTPSAINAASAEALLILTESPKRPSGYSQPVERHSFSVAP